jgi:tripartite-type tricarboxylate transporter receptor subunit TctC
MLGIARPALAQAGWPGQPIRLVVPFAAAGGTDLAARVIADHLSRILPQRVVVENRTGGGVTVGTDLVARAAPDGHTLLYTTIAHSVLRATVRRLPFMPEALVPVILVGAVPMVLVTSRTVPAETLQGFVAWARRRPDGIDAATSGPGSSPHLALVLLQRLTGMPMTFIVYRGSATTFSDLASERIQLAAPVGFAMAQDPRFRPLAVTTRTRAALMPDLPTAEEAGLPGYEAYTWHMLMAPPGTDPALVATINTAFRSAVANPEVSARLAAQEMTPMAGSPAEAAAFLATETARWSRMLADAGVAPE